MQYSNSQILSAVLNRWLQPVVRQLAAQHLSSLPVIAAIENKVKTSGWVRPDWSMAVELAPFMENVTGSVLEPLISSYMSQVPDAAIPQMAHGIVDKAMQNGSFSLFDGKITFDANDLQELKALLDYNLPLNNEEHYQVKTSAEQ